MTHVITELTAAPGHSSAEPFAGPDNPIRIITREIALEGKWNSDIRGRIASTFDDLASDWSESHVNPVKAAPVRDALERGRIPVGGTWLELGSGTGAGGRIMAERAAGYIAFDLSAEMLRHDPADAVTNMQQVRGDASALPLVNGSVDGILCINMFLFPDEVRRVLRPDGVLLWVNTMGDQTPIHLPLADVLTALGPEWAATTACAGTGFWATVRRT